MVAFCPEKVGRDGMRNTGGGLARENQEHLCVNTNRGRKRRMQVGS